MNQKVSSQVGAFNAGPAQMMHCRRTGGAYPPSGMVRVRNVVSLIVPTRTVDSDPQGSACERAGMGGRRKRKPRCNGADRGSRFASLRKQADFRLVLIHENGQERLNLRGVFGQ